MLRHVVFETTKARTASVFLELNKVPKWSYFSMDGTRFRKSNRIVL